MAEAADFRVSVAFALSRKRKRMHRRLGAEGVVAVYDLWALVARSYSDGDLSGLSNEDLADELDWGGDPDELCKALSEIGFLDGEEGGYAVHDWADHNPYAAGAKARSEQGKKAADERWKRCKGAKTKTAEKGLGDAVHAEIPISSAGAGTSNAPTSQPANQPTTSTSVLTNGSDLERLAAGRGWCVQLWANQRTAIHEISGACGGQVPGEWVTEAVRQTETRGIPHQKRVDYFLGILRNWQANGGPRQRGSPAVEPTRRPQTPPKPSPQTETARGWCERAAVYAGSDPDKLAHVAETFGSERRFREFVEKLWPNIADRKAVDDLFDQKTWEPVCLAS